MKIVFLSRLYFNRLEQTLFLLKGAIFMNYKQLYKLGIDIGSTTVKIAILDTENNVLGSLTHHFYNFP